MKLFRLMAVLLVTIAAVPVAAHHSFSAEYDFNKPLKLKGKVTEMKWANPHAWIYIDVAGTVLVIDGYQARNGSKTANATSITFENGKRLFAGSSSQNSATK